MAGVWTSTVDVAAGTTASATDRNLYIGATSNLQYLYENRITKIAEFVLAIATASITFSSIPGTYRHLMLAWEGRGDTAATNTALVVQANADAGTNYDVQLVNTSAASTTSAATTATANPQLGFMSAASAPAAYAGGGQIVVPNYTSTTFHKMLVCTTAWQTGAGAGQVDLSSVFWHPASPVAITSLKFFPSAGNFVAGGNFQLYGMN